MNDFRQQAISGVKWTGGSTAFGMVLQFAQMAVLARYLSAEAFGLFAEAMVVVGIALAFVDVGLSPALVQRERVDGRTISALFWFVAGISLACGFLVWITSDWVAAFYGVPELVSLLKIASLFVIVFGVGQVPLAVLQKELAFDRLSKVDVVSTVLGVTTAVSCAMGGLGAQAPLLGLLVSGIVRLSGLLIVVQGVWRPSLHFSLVETKPFLSFGAYQTGERFVNYLAANLDFVIIGRFLGPAALGPYYIAYQVVVQPMVRLNPVLTRVAFPLFSKVQEEDSVICRGYVRITKLVAFVSVPLLIGMAVVAPSFFRVYLGTEWEESDFLSTIQLAQILVPVSMLKCLANPLGSAFLAKGRPDIGFGLNGSRLVLNAVLFCWSLQWGLQGVALAYVVSSVLAFWAGHYLLGRILPLGLGSMLRAVASTVFAGTVMGILVSLAQFGTAGILIQPLHKLFFLVSLGGTAYALLVFRLEQPLLVDIRRWISGDGGRSDPEGDL